MARKSVKNSCTKYKRIFEDWSRKNLRQENGKIIQALFFVKISIFWRAGRRKLGDIVKLLRAYFAEIAPEKACKKTCQQYCSYFLHIHMWAWS